MYTSDISLFIDIIIIDIIIRIIIIIIIITSVCMLSDNLSQVWDKMRISCKHAVVCLGLNILGGTCFNSLHLLFSPTLLPQCVRSKVYISPM